MSKIIKNNTINDIFISDTGVTISANSQYTIPAQDYLLWAASNNAVTFIGTEILTVNDGSQDLSISDGTDLIKGYFPKKIIGNTTDTAIGNVEDSLKVILPSTQIDEILNSIDRIVLITYADFGTCNQRITKLIYTSPSIPGIEAHKTLLYTLVGNKYRKDSIVWSIENV